MNDKAKVWKENIIENLYYRGTTKLRNEMKRNGKWRNETKRNEVSQNETKYVKESIKDPKTVNEGVKINEILSG